MIKYIPELTSVVIEEIPDRLTLALEISRCKGRCEGCHSPFLREDIGENLTEEVIDKLLEENFGINCVLFLGEGDDPAALLRLADYVRTAHNLEVALYSGREDVEPEVWAAFDYVKVGPYIAGKGPLNKPGTNQRLYHLAHKGAGQIEKTDITFRLQHRGLDPILNGKG